MGRTGTSRSCPSGPARQVAGRHVVGQPDAVGGLVEGVAGRVHGRGVHRQDDGRLAARAHLGGGRRGGGRTGLTHTSRGTPPPSTRPGPAPGRAREFIGHTATPTILKGPLRRRGPALSCRPPDPDVLMDLTNASAIVTGGRGDFARWPNFLGTPQSEVPRIALQWSSRRAGRSVMLTGRSVRAPPEGTVWRKGQP